MISARKYWRVSRARADSPELLAGGPSRPSLRVFLAITPHGFGHAAQASVVVAALRQRFTVDLAIQSDLPVSKLNEKFGHSWALLPSVDDFGVVMRDSLTPDWPATATAYRAVMSREQASVRRVADAIRSFRPDLVLSNVSPLVCRAAKQCGIPNMAFCSLDWAAILAASPLADQAADIIDWLAGGYAAADRYVALTPGMPSDHHPRCRRVGPLPELPRVSQGVRQQVRSEFGQRPLILCGFGGIEQPISDHHWGADPRVAWLVPEHIAAPARGRRDWQSFGLPFSVLLQCVDAVFTKPGYGTFVAAAYAGTPVFYLPRPAWPESEFLVEWLASFVPCEAASFELAAERQLAERLIALRSRRGGCELPVSGVAGILAVVDELLAMA